MYVRSRQVAQVCNSCVMRILEPRFTAALLKGDLKISFYRVVEEGFHKHLARVYARRIWAFFFSSSVCSLFFFSFFVYTVLRDAQLSSTTIGCSDDNLQSRMTDKSKLCFE